MFDWKNKTVAQRAEQLRRLALKYTATKNFGKQCCLDCDEDIDKGMDYLSNADGKWKGHLKCVIRVLEPFGLVDAGKVLTEFTKPKSDRFFNPVQEEDDDETLAKYEASDWAPIVEASTTLVTDKVFPVKTEYQDMTVKDAATFLGIHIRAMYREIEKGKYVKNGRFVSIPVNVVELSKPVEKEERALCLSVPALAEVPTSLQDLERKVIGLTAKVEMFENMFETLVKPVFMKLAEGR